MSSVVSTEDGKTAQVDIPVDWKSVKVVCMSKQIDPIRNTDRQKRPKLYHLIDIGCHYDKNTNKIKPLEFHVIALINGQGFSDNVLIVLTLNRPLSLDGRLGCALLIGRKSVY